MTAIDELRTRITGPVLVPGDDGFAEEVTGFNLAASYAPDVAVGVTSEADVAEAVAFAAANGLRVHLQATGHGAEGAIDGGVLVVLKRLNSVIIDTAASVATIGGGTRWGVVVEAAGALGLTAITGSSPNVGAVGYTLGGGLGPLARSHGFSSDYVRGFRIVTGDGVARTANATENPDLFWALRGGKSGFGVVVSMDFALVPLTDIYAGSIMFSKENIETVLRGWLDWTADAPADVTTSAAIMRFPPLDVVPEPLRGKTLLSLRFAYPGDAEEGARLAAPLRALAPAMMDMVGPMKTTAMAAIHSDPTDPSPAWVNGLELSGVAGGLSDAFLSVVGPSVEAPIVAAELRHIGEKTAVDVAGGSAVGGRAGQYTLNVVAITPPGMPAGVLPGFWAGLESAVAPWTSSETTINFAGHPSPEDYAKSWSAAAFARITEVANQYDPESLFTWRAVAG
ncbi:MAG: FAD-binding protein [Microbacteriaceae bacterium]|nr:FAD-binding protein [Microbacteriaceae bacterium]